MQVSHRYKSMITGMMVLILILLFSNQASANNPATTYTNDFSTDTTGDFIALTADDRGELTYNVFNQHVRISGNDLGNVVKIDTKSPVIKDGIVSANINITDTDDARTGLVFRAVDSDTYTWVAVENGTALRIRERIGGVMSDIIHDGLTLAEGPTTLKVTYIGDNLKVEYGDAVVYDGFRPHRANNMGTSPVPGQIGFVAWAITDVTYDNLQVINKDINVTDILDASLAPQTKPAAIDYVGRTVTLFVPVDSDLSALEPSFTLHNGAVITPGAPQDFTAGPINYTVTHGTEQSAWSVSVVLDDRTMIHNASLEIETRAAVIDKVGKTITLFVAEEEDQSALEPFFTLYDEAVITPDTAQDFTAGPVNYTVTAGSRQSVWRVSIDTDNHATVIGTPDMQVTLDKTYPQVLNYKLTGGGVIQGASISNSGAPAITINGTDYPVSVVYNEAAADTATYTVTVADVSINGTPRTVTLDYRFQVVGTTLIKTLTGITGDEEDAPFRVILNSPVLRVTTDMAGAGVAASNYSENIGLLEDLDAFSMPEASFGFVWNKQAVGTVYIPSSFDKSLSVTNADGEATIFETEYQHRLSDGSRPVKETSLNILKPLVYESRVHIGKDSNHNDKIDWQDGALWVKAQLPQLPAELKTFFNGGGWSQTHGAFPGYAGDASYFKGFTVVYSTLDQLVEIQRQVNNMTDGVGRQSYEYVGWNGRGHDYGWPSINEIYYNPALGTPASMLAAKNAMAGYGGDLSFHINMSDMTDISDAYLRDTTPSIYGDRSSSTGKISYSSSVFGWDAYQISHYTDVKNGYPVNRQNDFVEKYWAPLIMYQDVMLDYPYNGYGKAEERYAKSREIDHWRALGTYTATEFYAAEARMNGLFMFKNYVSPTLIDSFMNAGMSIMHATRWYATQPADYIWGTLVSDNIRNGNLNVAEASNQSSVGLTRTTFLYSLLNGYIANSGLEEYVDEATRTYTRWGEDIIYEIDKSTQAVTVTDGDVTIAKGQDRFIPAIDGTNRIFVYSVEGNTNTWRLPANWRTQSQLKLYELTADGRKFAGTVHVVDGNVTLATDALRAYVLTPDELDTVSEVNAALTATIAASSNSNVLYNTSTHMYNGMEYRYITNDSAPDNDWTTVLKKMTPGVMIDSEGTIRYEMPIVAGFTADGVANTYWSPNADPSRGPVDMADGEAWLEYSFPNKLSLSRITIVEADGADNELTSFKLQYWNNNVWLDMYSDTKIPTEDIHLSNKSTSEVRLLFGSAESNNPRIAEVSIYGEPVNDDDGNGGGDGNGNGGGITSPGAGTESSRMAVTANGKPASFAVGTVRTDEEGTHTTIQVDLDKLYEILTQGHGQQLAIQVPDEGEIIVQGLTAASIRKLSDAGATLDIGNLLAAYSLSAGLLDLDAIAGKWDQAKLEDIAVNITIKRSPQKQVTSAQRQAVALGYEWVVSPVTLDLVFSFNGQTVRPERLNGYAVKEIVLPEGVGLDGVMTGVVIHADGSIFHVPTEVTKVNNRYVARIHDMRGFGAYAVIRNSKEFADLDRHWARTEILDMSARLNLEGTGGNYFSPNRNVTRAEFVSILMLGMGLMEQNVPASRFEDVQDNAWYRDAAALADVYGLVNGYPDGSFNGSGILTREQGMSILARAYRLIDPQVAIHQGQIDASLANFKDGESVSAWAKGDVALLIEAGLVQGNGGKLLNPKSEMTRAEVTTLVARMLKENHLIDL